MATKQLSWRRARQPGDLEKSTPGDMTMDYRLLLATDNLNAHIHRYCLPWGMAGCPVVHNSHLVDSSRQKGGHN